MLLLLIGHEISVSIPPGCMGVGGISHLSKTIIKFFFLLRLAHCQPGLYVADKGTSESSFLPGLVPCQTRTLCRQLGDFSLRPRTHDG